MTTTASNIFTKRGYELVPADFYSLAEGVQVYVKIDGVATPAKITKCWKGGLKYSVDLL